MTLRRWFILKYVRVERSVRNNSCASVIVSHSIKAIFLRLTTYNCNEQVRSTQAVTIQFFCLCIRLLYLIKKNNPSDSCSNFHDCIKDFCPLLQQPNWMKAERPAKTHFWFRDRHPSFAKEFRPPQNSGCTVSVVDCSLANDTHPLLLLWQIVAPAHQLATTKHFGRWFRKRWIGQSYIKVDGVWSSLLLGEWFPKCHCDSTVDTVL